MDCKDCENAQLRQELDRLNRELQAKRSQPQIDVSLVEILKQQIQVCTDDFNSERKDREEAVNRSKELENDVKRLLAEVCVIKV